MSIIFLLCFVVLVTSQSPCTYRDIHYSCGDVRKSMNMDTGDEITFKCCNNEWIKCKNIYDPPESHATIPKFIMCPAGFFCCL